MFAAVEKRTIDRVKLAYRVAGDPAAPLIVLIHGLTGSSSDWEQTAQALAAAGWRIIAPDCPGHGGSEAPNEPEVYDPANVGDLLHALVLEQTHTPAVLVGNSMGGAIAQEYAIRHRRDARALVLVDSAGDLRQPITRQPGHQDFVEKELKVGLEEGMAAIWELHQEMRGWMFAGNFPLHIQELMKARVCRTSAKGYLFGDRALGTRRKTLADLARLDIPTLVMCCEHEGRMLKDVAEDLAATIPEAKYEIIPSAWHQPQLENPAAFNSALLNFLAVLS